MNQMRLIISLKPEIDPNNIKHFSSYTHREHITSSVRFEGFMAVHMKINYYLF
jgi:hypothetical protein